MKKKKKKKEEEVKVKELGEVDDDFKSEFEIREKK